MAAAERRVGVRERRVAELRAQLEDPALYLTADAAAQAQRLGRELEDARAELDAAFAEWEAATRAEETGD